MDSDSSQCEHSKGTSAAQGMRKRKKFQIQSPQNSPPWYTEIVRVLQSELEKPTRLNRQNLGDIIQLALNSALNVYNQNKRMKEDDSQISALSTEMKDLKAMVENLVSRPIPQSYATITAQAASTSPPITAKPKTHDLVITFPNLYQRSNPEELQHLKQKVASIVEPKKPFKSSSGALRTIQFVRIRQSHRGNLVLQFPDKEQKLEAWSRIARKDKQMAIKDPDDKKIPIKVHYVPHQDSEILKASFFENNTSVLQHCTEEDIEMYWIPVGKDLRNQPKFYILKLMAPQQTALKIINQGRLYVELESYQCSLWKMTPRRCKKCLQFHHGEKFCRNKMACAYCAEEHDSNTCPKTAPVRCTNCYTSKSDEHDHSALSNTCPAWIHECRKAQQEMIDFLYRSS